ncbi:hypothetical protein [Ferrovibrio sp.]|uniref:hypothetical protein n=1 Tax=Ferrovibrio sp. TaxID=1917215 RepID=UPI0035B043A2
MSANQPLASHATDLTAIAGALRQWVRCGDSLPPDRIRLLADLLDNQAETLRLAQLTIDQFILLEEQFRQSVAHPPIKEAAE